MAASIVKCCVFCFGNTARGDDALGERMHTWLQQAQQNHAEFLQHIDLQLILDFQLQPEHIFDLHEADCGIFIDAHQNAESGVQWQPVAAGTTLQFTSHHLPVESLLYLYETTFNIPAPPCRLLGIAGQDFELGNMLSELAQHNLAAACELLQGKLKELKSGNCC